MMNSNNSDIEKASVVILAGSRDFGRCQIASRMPVSLWPVLGRPAIERVIRALAAQGIENACVCSEGDISPFKELEAKIPGIDLNFFQEPLRAGTAGCIRDTIDMKRGELIVVIPASMICLPDIKGLLRAHLEHNAILTAALNPDNEETLTSSSTGIYICDGKVLEYIPQGGYCDIKEWLVSELVRSGNVVKTFKLPCDTGNFRDAKTYLRAMTGYLEKAQTLNDEIPFPRRDERQCLWLDDGATIDPTVRFFGPVMVMRGAEVAKDAVVFGPSVIGRNCRLGPDTLVVNSVLWDEAEIGANCEIRNCLFDYNTKITKDTVASYKTFPFEKTSTIVSLAVLLKEICKSGISGLRNFMWQGTSRYGETSITAGSGEIPKSAWLAGVAIIVAFIWSYWPVVVDLCNIWLRNDEYSSGMLVPFLAVYILWSRRDILKTVPIKPNMFGLLVMLFAEALRLFGVFFMYGSAERISVVVAIAALVLFLLGWQFFKKTATILLFLCLMLPWPNSVQAVVALPLQRWATSSAVFCLETIGYNVLREGNVINIGQSSVAVAEACNGLRMITAFFVISGLVVMLIKRPRWEKTVVLVSSLPIALLCNTTRLVITAIAFTFIKGDYWEKTFHDFGGYAMVPLALAAVIGEFWLLRRLTVLPTERKSVIIVRQ
jgi:exosortase